MKLKKDFLLKKISGQYVIVPVGSYAVDFNGIITLNETAKFMWEKCTGDIDPSSLIDIVKTEYKVDDDTAKAAVEKFLSELNEAGCLE